MIAALWLVAAAAADDTYVWHAANGPGTVQYGLPGSDDRALRIDCVDGRLSIAGPSSVEGPDGTVTWVTFTTAAGPRRRQATLGYAGDGINFFAEVRADDPALRTLMAGRTLRIRHGASEWQVPGSGAAPLLGPLIRSCRR
jgi:hypothetical protein